MTYLVLFMPTYGIKQPGLAPSVAFAAIALTGAIQLVFSPLVGHLSEIFPVQTPTTGMSLAYNIAVTIFGGVGPFIIAWLIRATESKVAPSYYMIFAALISPIGLIAARRKLGFN